MSTTDGVVTIRSPEPGDAAILVAGRDVEFHRWLGEGADDPDPTACIVVDDTVVGWIDFDTDRDWLQPGEVNVGYHVFATHRGNGYASRAVLLLGHHLLAHTPHRVMTLLIDAGNDRSLAVAHRLAFTELAARPTQPPGQRFFTCPVSACTEPRD